jgi:TolB-like protein/DNA-binding winged helix-turn-helix (wHTH) protein
VGAVLSPPTYKFNEFELDGARFELRRAGRVQKLERIPLELLILLAEKNGEVVSRQEIIERLWGKDVFVDTEHGINTAIRKIRAALRDDVERSRYIQTVSGKGYRFIGEFNADNAVSASVPEQARAVPRLTAHERSGRPVHTKSGRWKWAAVAFALIFVAGTLFAFNVGGLRGYIFSRHQVGPIHSIAVLPLTNLSGDPSQDYFADGITDELITALAENRSLRVVSRTSAMQYKGVNKPLREIAQSLGVDGILEGSVNRSANRVHVNLQLIYAPTDTHIWAQSYDRDLNAAMSLPAELAQVIATQAKVDPTPVRPSRAMNPEAHDAYLRGRYFWFAENGDRGRAYFQKAVELQPDYAAAWDGLGDTYGEQAVGGELPPQEAFAKSEELVQKALGLDDSLPEAHNSMAAICLFNKWDFRRAEAEALRALELKPNYAEGRFIHSYILLVTNREEEALQEQKRANDISAFERPWALGFLYIHLRQYDQAINELQARAKTNQSDTIGRFLLSEAYWLKGMKKESEEAFEKAWTESGDATGAQAFHRAFERGGESAAEQLRLKNILERARKQYVSPYEIANQYALLGDKEHALKFLDVAYRERSPWLPFLQKEPVFDFLHADPSYRTLVAKIGLPPAY